MPADSRRFFARAAWVRGAWANDVLLEAGPDGHWSRVEPGVDPQGATVLAGPVLPGLVDAHSHAFQRAIAGITEHTSGGEDDDFWSWRDTMYRVALRITPAQMEAIATMLYAELVLAGYTQVCDFHYLHNDGDGRPYADPLELSMALVRAARRTGIGLTLLPTLYMRSGFGASGLREDQRRFASTPASVLRIAEGVAGLGPRVNAGVAIHSLRAADPGAIRELLLGAREDLPVHIHIAEQRKEVEDCLLAHGKGPVEWLMSQVTVDGRWNMVHATQCGREDLARLRDAGASVVICPTTEANLGDGIFDFPGWAGQSGHWSIGSDSHVTRSWREELRLLEYSQRLHLRRRNVAAHATVTTSTAAALFEGALHGGSAATGIALGGLQVGQRADFVVADPDAIELAGVPEARLLDALVFSSPETPWREVYVAADRIRLDMAPIAAGYRAALGELLT